MRKFKKVKFKLNFEFERDKQPTIHGKVYPDVVVEFDDDTEITVMVSYDDSITINDNNLTEFEREYLERILNDENYGLPECVDDYAENIFGESSGEILLNENGDPENIIID